MGIVRMTGLNRPSTRLAFLCLSLCVILVHASEREQLLQKGVQARDAGNLYESIALLESAVKLSPDKTSRASALTHLGVSLGQAGRVSEAKVVLLDAYRDTPAAARSRITLALGNIALRAQDWQGARSCYEEVLASGDADYDTKISAQLNLVRLESLAERLMTLQQLVPAIETMKADLPRARALLSVGEQALDLIPFSPTTSLLSSGSSKSEGTIENALPTQTYQDTESRGVFFQRP